MARTSDVSLLCTSATVGVTLMDNRRNYIAAVRGQRRYTTRCHCQLCWSDIRPKLCRVATAHSDDRTATNAASELGRYVVHAVSCTAAPAWYIGRDVIRDVLVIISIIHAHQLPFLRL